jgi:hypothetical protein
MNTFGVAHLTRRRSWTSSARCATTSSRRSSSPSARADPLVKSATLEGAVLRASLRNARSAANLPRAAPGATAEVPAERRGARRYSGGTRGAAYKAEQTMTRRR